MTTSVSTIKGAGDLRRISGDGEFKIHPLDEKTDARSLLDDQKMPLRPSLMIWCDWSKDGSVAPAAMSIHLQTSSEIPFCRRCCLGRSW